MNGESENFSISKFIISPKSLISKINLIKSNPGIILNTKGMSKPNFLEIGHDRGEIEERKQEENCSRNRVYQNHI